jgi:hypothetical protein
MKKISISSFLLLCVSFINAQEVIKVGEEKTITCTGQFIAEVQNYYSNGKPASKSRAFVDATKDSLIFFTAIIDNKETNQVVFKNVIAKKDVELGDWGFEVEAVKENGASFQMLKIKTINGNSLISEEKYSWDGIEKNDATNRVYIYFENDKVVDAKAWAEKIKKMLS